MSRRSALLVMMLGTTLARLALGGTHRRYVRAAMGPWLVVTGLVLLGLGAVTLLAGPRRTGAHGDPRDDEQGYLDHEHEHEHDHGGSRVAWLLLAPILVLFLVGPSPLGSFAADRALIAAPRVSARRPFPPLPLGTDGVAELTLTQYVERGMFDTSASLQKTPVRLTGFVMPDAKGGADFLLTRFQVACCAADGQATQIRIVGAPVPVPGRDEWVEVTGRMVTPADAATMRVERLRVIPAPDDPYEEA